MRNSLQKVKTLVKRETRAERMNEEEEEEEVEALGRTGVRKIGQGKEVRCLR